MSVAAPNCKCGKEASKRQVTDEKKLSFGKWFYGCSGNSRKGEPNCGFFKFEEVWETEFKSGNTVYPVCKCGKECKKCQTKKNKDNWFFVCPDRQGYDDPNHDFMWENDWIKERKGQQSMDKFMKPAKKRSRSKSPTKREESPLRERD